MRLFGAVLMALLATPALAEPIVAARYADPTDRYAHGILGDAIEWGALEILTDNSDGITRIELPRDHVFEDVAPRLIDVTGDGDPEVIVVETDVRLGGALAIYGTAGKIAETPHIGRSNRWLAPIGAADLDGDGHIEIAYVDRPHLAKTVRVWRFRDNALIPLADLPGFTNHKIGEPGIAGGIRTCAATPEMIVATADWRHVAALRFDGQKFSMRHLQQHRGRDSFARAMKC